MRIDPRVKFGGYK